MKLAFLYHPNSEDARKVEEFAHDFIRQTGGNIELISLETMAGAEMARVYGIVSYPAILARRDNGELVNSWEGDTLPLMSEVAGYISV